MYVIDTRHYLDDKGDIGPEKGPARNMADFVTSVIAHASDFDRRKARSDQSASSAASATTAAWTLA